MKKLRTLFIVLMICVSTAHSQIPVITMTSDFPDGSDFSFALQGPQNTIIQIDFGDGKLVNDTIRLGWSNVSGTKVGQTIKIYGGTLQLFCVQAEI